MTKPILYGSTLSPFVRKVKVVLLEKNIDHEAVNLTPFPKTPELLALNPLGKIPIFKEENGRIINESAVMIAYIEEKYPEPALLPKDLYERSRARFFEAYMGGHFASTLLLGLFFEKIIKPAIFQQQPEQKNIDAALEAAPGILQYLEKELEGKEYFAGNMFTIADISMASGFCNLKFAGFEIDGEKYPTLGKWWQNITSRPSFAGIIKENEEMLKGFQNAG